jgi:hypothetical protein
MIEPSPTRPVPGPPRPGSGTRPADPAAPSTAPTAEPATADDAAGRFADLEQRPVAEHVGVFEAEHDRLQRELGTIDQL